MSETTEITEVIHPGNTGTIAMNSRRFTIPGDMVYRATADLSDHQRSAIRGMHAYAVEKDLSLVEQGQLLKISDTTLSLIYRGKYEAKLDNVVKIMADFLTLEEKRNENHRLPFIETALTRKIWNVCERAREFQKIAFIFSDSQVGKSTAFEEYYRTHNHGSTIYTEMPTGGGLTHYLAELASRLKISTNLSSTEMRRRIFDAFDDRMLLIVDEASRAIAIKGSGKRSTSLETIDFIRELFNRRKCGVVICGTNVFRDAMERGSVMEILKQLLRRRLCILQLPNTPTRDDLISFSNAYGLPPSEGVARELENRVVENEALGMWLLTLRMAAEIAAKRKVKMTWSHVIDASNAQKSMETASK